MSLFQEFMWARIEKVLNAYLQLDPSFNTHLAFLQGKVLALNFTHLPVALTVYITAIDGRIQLSGYAPRTDTLIRGTPLNFATAALASHRKEKSEFSKDLIIEGNQELAYELQRAFSQFNINWEELFSNIVGDSLAHELGNSLYKASEWLKQTQSSVHMNVQEYLQEESGYFPSPNACEAFYEEVDENKMAVDRLQIRIDSLEKRLKSTHATLKKSSEHN